VTGVWTPGPGANPGELWPCGTNPDGSVREFFAHKDDVQTLLADGLTVNEMSTRLVFQCEMTATPFYGNGDVQIRAVRVSG
jgi:hypothetical protein